MRRLEPDDDLEIEREHMEQLRDRVRAELIDRYHCAVIASRAARKAGYHEEAKVRADEARLVRSMLQSMHVPENAIDSDTLTRIQEGI